MQLAIPSEIFGLLGQKLGSWGQFFEKLSFRPSIWSIFITLGVHKVFSLSTINNLTSFVFGQLVERNNKPLVNSMP